MGHYVVLHQDGSADVKPFSKPVEEFFRKCEYCDSWYPLELTECPKCSAPAKDMHRKVM